MTFDEKINLIYHDNDVLEYWKNLKKPKFLQYDFLHTFSIYNTNVRHLFFSNKKSFLYAQLFILNLAKTFNYAPQKSIINYVFSFFNIRVLYMGNSYMTNFPFFLFNKKHDLSDFLQHDQLNWSAFIVPDFIMIHLTNKKKYIFSKLEVEENMVLGIKEKWFSVDCYLNSLKSKYRKNMNNILRNSQDINVKLIQFSDFNNFSNELQILFNKITRSSKFSGPAFNIKTYLSLIEKNYARLYGYFLNDQLIAFSSELVDGGELYSHYVGFDPEINNKYSIYGRILIETINNAINERCQKIIFGRSASEFKSNFGAKPIKSHVFIGFKNIILSYVFGFLLKRIHIKHWVQRRPFKSL